ncbi:hypothetical protein BGZ82_009677 [Podila clonocystis]|nr:hypothetical protein BGZ82_009677 [Podila clonocystis]
MKFSTVSTVLVLATAIALANAKAIDKRDDIPADYAAIEQQEGVATLLKRLVDTAIGAEEAPQTEDLIIVPEATSLVDKVVTQLVKEDKDNQDENDEDEDEDEDDDDEEDDDDDEDEGFEEEANGVDVFVADSNFCTALAADSLMTVEQATAQQAAITKANAIAEAEEAEEDEADYDDEDEDYEDEDDDDEYDDDEYDDDEYDDDEYDDDEDDEDEYDEDEEEDENEADVEAQAEEPKIITEASEIPEDIVSDATKETIFEATVEKPTAQEPLVKRHHHHKQ